MKSTSIRRIAMTAVLIIMILASAAAPAPAADTAQPDVCSTWEEIAGYILKMVSDREEDFSLSVPKEMPDAGRDAFELLRAVLELDTGFIRWGCKSVGANKAESDGYVTFSYKLQYRTTKEQDEAARKLAAGTVEKWNVKSLPGYEKTDKLRRYISNNWRYDKTLENMNAYSTLSSGKGTCLGFVMACQLLLDEMGIPSQTVHGRSEAAGELHIMLLVKLGNWWYTFDPTPLARAKPDLSSYLKSNYDKTFIPNDEYLTESFRRAHPMNRGDLKEPGVAP